MRIGTKSVLFGVHQFLWHPLTVLLAWRKLYKSWPHWAELIAIFLHDTPGYWSKPEMDGPEGVNHPYLGAFWTARIVVLVTQGYWIDQVPFENEHGGNIYAFTLLHSREVAKQWKCPTSKLYAADKCAILFDPAWFYLLRARLSGELYEYKGRAILSGHLPVDATDKEWYWFYHNHVINRPDIKKLL